MSSPHTQCLDNSNAKAITASLTRTYADVVEAQEAVVNAIVAELGADVADCDARQRLVGRQRPDLHYEAVRPIVLQAAPAILNYNPVTTALCSKKSAHMHLRMALGSTRCLTLPLMNRRAMHTTCVAVFPKPAHGGCHHPVLF